MTKQVTVYGPYSPLRQAGDLYFTAGQVGVDASTGVADADVRRQAVVALENLKTVLATAGLGLDAVVKATLFLADMDDFAVVNEVYLQYFAEPRPARSTVAVKELPRVAKSGVVRVEIEAVATGRREA